jgi:hypothetical protein
LYKRYQVPQLPWTPLQRKTPETMSASRTRSLINVEMIQTLVRMILANTQWPSSARSPRDVTRTDKGGSEDAVLVNDKIDANHK